MKPRELRLFPQAEHDVDTIVSYLAPDSIESAMRFLVRLRETFELLVEVPGAGALLTTDEEVLKGVRRWPIRGFLNYVVYYVPTEDTLDVIRVLHGARDRDSLLRDR